MFSSGIELNLLLLCPQTALLSPTASYVVVIASYPQEERVPNQKRKNPQEKREIGSRGLLRKRREKREGKGVISGVEEDETKQIDILYYK